MNTSVENELLRLCRAFEIERPVRVEYGHDGQDAFITSDEIIFRLPDDIKEDELSELVAIAKMGERDPLIAHIWYQKDRTEDDGRAMTSFFRIVTPLRTAWAFRVMARYDRDLYRAEVEWIATAVQFMIAKGTAMDLPSDEGFLLLKAYVTVKDSGLSKVELVTHHDLPPDWRSYLAALWYLVGEEPSAEGIVELARASNPRYRVNIVGDDPYSRYFDIRFDRSAQSGTE